MKKKILISTPLALGVIALAFLAGYNYRGTMVKAGPPKFIVIDRPVEIPAKEDSATAQPVRPDAARINLVDSLIALAIENDSLARWTETLSTPFETTFEDTIDTRDSLGSFYTRRIEKLDIDPLTRLVKRRISYLDSKLTTVKIEQPVVLEETWLDRVLWWVERIAWYGLGVITGGYLGG